MLMTRLPISKRLFVIVCLVLLAMGIALHLSRMLLDASDTGAPAKISVSEGEATGHVGIVWQEVDGADEYRVYRDGRSIATVDDVRYRDDDADAGVVHPPVITEVESRSDSVHLGWVEPYAEPGTRHAYSVTAVVDGEEVYQSPGVPGYRAAPAITGYQVKIDEGQWRDAGDETSFVDDTVEQPRPRAGTPSATRGDHYGMVALRLEGAAIEPGEPSSYRVRAVTEQGVSEPSATVEQRAEANEKRVRWQRAGDPEGEFEDIGETAEGTFFSIGDPRDRFSRYYRAVVETPGGGTDRTEVVRGYTAAAPDCLVANDEPKTLPSKPFGADSPAQIARLMKSNAEACLQQHQARLYQQVEVLGQEQFDDDRGYRVALIRAGLPGATMGKGRLYTAVQTAAGWFVFRTKDYISASHGSGGGTDKQTYFVDVERHEIETADGPKLVLHFHQVSGHYFSVPLGDMPEDGEPDVPDPYGQHELFAVVVGFADEAPELRGVARTHCHEATEDYDDPEHDIEAVDDIRIDIDSDGADTISVESPTVSGEVELQMPREEPTYRQGCGQ